MKEFLDFLRKGKFRVPICDNCNTKIWPPSNICRKCYSTKIKMSEINTKGGIVECLESFIGESKNLGLVELSGIRIIGVLSEGTMNPGIAVKLSNCGIDKENSPYYEFSPS